MIRQHAHRGLIVSNTLIGVDAMKDRAMFWPEQGSPLHLQTRFLPFRILPQQCDDLS